jgi:tetratricopeptide (TPR) repeat protein
MKRILIGLLAALALPLRAADAPKPAVLMEGFGSCHHEIATVSPEAQKFFDQGLCLVYSFNHEEAIHSFQRASELDPKAVMPLWGVAYSLGPNINMDVDPEHEKAAFEAEQKALAFSAQDALAYDEPPPWYGSVRETLGTALVADHRAAEAEKIFREDLARNPGSGRSLFGLWKSLEAQKKTGEAEIARKDYETAWKGADAPMTLADL